MKRLAVLTGILALVTPLALAQTSTWVLDSAHSEVGFSVVHLSLSKVRGHFGPVTGKVVIDQADITKSTVDVTIDVSGVDSGDSMRDSALKGSDFLDISKFPAATFVSTNVYKAPGGLTVTGNLTLRGVTRPVVLHVEGPTGPIDGIDQKQHEGFSATATLDRSAFGIGTGYPDKIVGNQITLTIDMEIVKQ